MPSQVSPKLILQRTLWSQPDGGKGEREVRQQAELLVCEEPLVILGEAGMGKSTLLEWLAGYPGYALCTARKLVNSHNPNRVLGDAKVLVVDALDELPGVKEGEGVDAVLRKLDEMGYPRFVLSCRVADWRSATGAQAIQELYPQKPLELYLEPLTDEDITKVLSAHVSRERAAEVRAYLGEQGLEGMLGNPETLQLIAEVAASGSLPTSKQELFAKATTLMWRDKPGKAEQQPAETAGLDAAGAACAALILTGSEAIACVMQANQSNDDLSLMEVALLPGAELLSEALETRLFRALGAGCFSYWHRSLGEFLGAQWLARHADTTRKRRRLLALFRSQGLVPANLRGLHAWLAHDPNLAQEVIEADPLGFVEYGDAGSLSLSQAHHLLTALQRETRNNPLFHVWHMAPAKGLFHPELTDTIRTILRSEDATFWLRDYLVESMQGTVAVNSLRVDLEQMLVDPDLPLGLGLSIVDTLSNLLDFDAWKKIVGSLNDARGTDTIRLVLHILDTVDYRLVDDAGIASLVVADVTANDRVIGVLFPLKQGLPFDRLDGVLSELSMKANMLDGLPDYRRDGALTGFVYTLLARRLGDVPVTAEQLWAWLSPFEAVNTYSNEDREHVAAYLNSHDDLRQATQRIALLKSTSDRDVDERAWRLSACSSGLQLSARDFVALLQKLDPANKKDMRWRDLASLGRARKEVIAAARVFAEGNAGHQAWLDGLLNPSEPEWVREQAEQEQKRKRKHEERTASIRKDYLDHIEEVRAGKLGAIRGPAQAYLGLFSVVSTESPPHQRIASWLGDELAEAAYIGFETFLKASPSNLSTTDIVVEASKGRILVASYIIVVALAERMRLGTGLDDLSDDRVMGGYCALRGGVFLHYAKLDELEPWVEAEVRRRGLFETALRSYCEPQLQIGKEYIGGLDTLMRNEADVALAAELALDWLNRFDGLHINIMQRLVSRVVHSPRVEALIPWLREHASMTDPERRRLLDAVGILVDFEHTIRRLTQTGISPELLWELRRLTGETNQDRRMRDTLAPAQTEWIIATFRQFWPVAYAPSGGWVGDSNAWDASQYLKTLLRHLGLDTSEPAVTALQRLQAAPADSYTDMMASIAAEQARTRAEAAYVSPTLGAVQAVTRDTIPVTMDDLMTVVLDELGTVQAKIRSDDVESWRGFFDDSCVPKQEEACRDHLAGLLRQGCQDLHFEVEAHKAADKEVDIDCCCGQLRLPIEIKGQWHDELWHAADTQLDRLYTTDWQAERRGIYLVLWFGPQQAKNKRLKGPPRGTAAKPKTSEKLQDALTIRSNAAKDGRVKVVVLDVSRDNDNASQ